jgi:ketosteroid isomerase-like protein
MKRLIAISFLMVSFQLNAQRTIEGLINAEKNFAAYSVAHGTKDAFLKFLDSNGVVFNQGKAVNGIETWSKREKGQQVLSWNPQYAEIATSNDFGYTTGPWELRPNATNDTVVARGQYTTVWHINANGEWKFLVDLGVGNTPKVLMLSLDKIKAKKVLGDATTSEVLKAEQSFINAYKTNRLKAYNTYLSRKSVLNRNGLFYPATSKKNQSVMIVNSPAVYGNTLINNKPENFLHIWRKEKEGWKMALEVLKY